MERLTEYLCGVAVIRNKDRLSEAMSRLAAYEDTGLTPQEIYGLKAGTILKALGWERGKE